MCIDKLFKDFPSEKDIIKMIRRVSSVAWENELIEEDISLWLGNFDGSYCDNKYERLMALWLLCNFTYYNIGEVKYLCKLLFQEFIHEIVKNNYADDQDVLLYVEDFLSKTVVVSPEKNSGSGGLIAYFFRQENNLSMSLFNDSIKNIPDYADNIVLIDDVVLTKGNEGQINSVLEKVNTAYSSKNIYLLSLIASKDAYDWIKNEKKVQIVSTVVLDERDKAFNEKSYVYDGMEEIRLRSKAFATHYGNKIYNYPLGYCDSQYLFGFFYNTPDNTLPIFWWQRNGWTPILKRYHKNYHNKKLFTDGTFI